MSKPKRIRKLLVANRGEIAIRIFRACRELGITSVAVYSEIDRDALHVTFADEAFLLGETAPATSYLNIGKILEIAKRAGADAVHPGYGFLAENPRFAEGVIEAGLIWVGPSPKAIESMGDKTAARKIAASVGVVSVPGTLDAMGSAAEISKFAAEHGWPVAIKAAHGGGGRGFRVVREQKDADSAFESAGREAQLAFGNPELYLERYLEQPRHVEIQIMGDSYGNLIHLGERDCSLQRRHQKLIEEAPSPAVDAALREEMGAAAVKVASASGYQSAGTVEFLLEKTEAEDRFWFLEVNTRLQVEHPVTEMVTGIDLVKEMIRVAEGEKLSISQGDLELRGHVVECRINAENPARNFLPAPGTIAAYREPGGPGVRVDSGCAAGSQIPQAYDSLIAKLICHGSGREEAIARCARALAEFKIEGIRTTIPFHQLVAESGWFHAGNFHTKTVEETLDLSKLDSQPAAASSKDRRPERKLTLEVGGKRFDVHLMERAAENSRAKPPAPNLTARTAHAGSGETITAPMQGTIVKTLVAEGAKVAAGDAILVLEAMKMENIIVCHRDGVVTQIAVKPGETVQGGAVLASIGPTE